MRAYREINSPLEHGNLLGTYDYAAPEYFQGYPGTFSSDLYSIGVICYEMLAGKLPYGGPLSAKAIKRARYIPANRINPEVPAWVDGAIEKAVQLNPKRRYDALSEFVADLSTPNANLVKESQPILERNPVAFWRALSIVLMLSNLIVLYLYVKNI